MTLPHGFSFDTATSKDKREIFQLDLWTFPSAVTLDQFVQKPEPFAFDRSVLVRSGSGELAAFHTSYAFAQFNVPGAQIPVSGLSWVGVHPQFRRKGILRAMIAKHFADCVARGESVSALYAAEPTIYGRFGYGRASHDVRFTLGRGAAQRALFRSGSGSAGESSSSSELTVRIELFDEKTHVPVIEDLHVRAGQNVNDTGLNRPGWATRETEQLRAALHYVNDVNPTRETPRIVIVERAGEPVGYSVFRRKVTWENEGASGDVDAGEVIALDAAASRKLWEVLSDFDLTDSVTAFMVPTDDPLLGRLENTRSIKMQHVDNVWTRIINLPAALEGRQYASDVEVVFEVTDGMLPENAGRWKLTAAAFDGPSGSRTPKVERSEEPAEIVLDIRELSTVYLGGPSLASLAAAGLIESRNPRALATASVAFGWPHAPMSTWVF